VKIVLTSSVSNVNLTTCVPSSLTLGAQLMDFEWFILSHDVFISSTGGQAADEATDPFDNFFGSDSKAHIKRKKISCEIHLLVMRNAQAFLVSRILPCCLIVTGGLGAAWLDPTQAPMVAGRVALMITAMLTVINMTNQVKLRLTKIMWIDTFNLVQIFVLLIGIIATVVIHLEHRVGSKQRALALDQSARSVVGLMYFGYTVSVCVGGYTRSWSTIGFACLATTISVFVFNRFQIWWILRGKQRALSASLDALDAAEFTTDEGVELAQQLFRLCDEDDSGRIEVPEAAKMLMQWSEHGSHSRPPLTIARAYYNARKMTNNDSSGSMGLGKFIEMLQQEQARSTDSRFTMSDDSIPLSARNESGHTWARRVSSLVSNIGATDVKFWNPFARVATAAPESEVATHNLRIGRQRSSGVVELQEATVESSTSVSVAVPVAVEGVEEESGLEGLPADASVDREEESEHTLPLHTIA